MDERHREDELKDETLVEETAEDGQAPLSENEQAADPDMVPGEIEPAPEEQVSRQVAAADPSMDAAGSSGTQATGQIFDIEQDIPSGPMFDDHETEELRSGWLDVQSSFIDDPSASVEAADEFIDELLDKIRTNLSTRRSVLKSGWNNGGDELTTEEFRSHLKRYRSFLDRLLELQI